MAYTLHHHCLPLLRRNFTFPTTDDFTVNCIVALLLSWLITGALITQLKSLQAEKDYSDRRRRYWQELAGIEADFHRAAEEQLQRHLQNAQQQNSDWGVGTDSVAGKRNPEEQTWRL